MMDGNPNKNNRIYDGDGWDVSDDAVIGISSSGDALSIQADGTLTIAGGLQAATGNLSIGGSQKGKKDGIRIMRQHPLNWKDFLHNLFSFTILFFNKQLRHK